VEIALIAGAAMVLAIIACLGLLAAGLLVLGGSDDAGRRY
jgi:hypothetical protein